MLTVLSLSKEDRELVVRQAHHPELGRRVERQPQVGPNVRFGLFHASVSVINYNAVFIQLNVPILLARACSGWKGEVMLRSVLLSVFAVLVVLQPLAVCAQGKTANLVGYEKADYVTGMFSVNATGNSVALIGLKTFYDKPLEVYVSRSFDRSGAFKVGEVASDKRGDVFFDIPALDLGGFDSVLLMVPGWDVPVGVGLLQ
jgi:hypothetical protein